MRSLTEFGLREEYKQLERLGDKLSEIESLIDLEPFRPIIKEMYNNKTFGTIHCDGQPYHL